jgi:MerR family transcriptional regulator, redox-sensitive transcriptional activator SoxR
MSIGELARRAGLAASAIRYYESIGLLEAPPRVAGKRRYRQEALQRLSVIAAGRHAGLSLDEVAELVRADEQGQVSSRLQVLARQKLPEIDALIMRAGAVRAWLEAAADCRCPSLEQCPLFDSTT